MGMTNENLCDSCINRGCIFQSGIVRTECAFYIPPHIEPDNCGNYVVMQPPKEGLKDTSEKELAIIEGEYISKADYEERLKADMVAMLEDLDLQIDEMGSYNRGVAKVQRLIRDKINALKENKGG